MGEGGFASVILGFDSEDHQKVYAIKEINKKEDVQRNEMIKNELKIKIDSHHIIKIIDTL